MSFSLREEIERITHNEVSELVNRLPYGAWHREIFKNEDGIWRFAIECKSETHHFSASASGKSPSEAFALAKQIILNQIRNWQNSRFTDDAAEEAAAPHVLIIDDDVALALAMQKALEQLGCKTEIATQHEGLHRKLTFGDADYIFMDWKLNDEVTADRVVEKAVRLIDTFSDLRAKFKEQRPRIVTYSALERDEVVLPEQVNEYFDHLDHWMKPMPFRELIHRAAGLLAAH